MFTPKKKKRRIWKQNFKKYFVPICNLWYKDQSLPVFKKNNFVEIFRENRKTGSGRPNRRTSVQRL